MTPVLVVAVLTWNLVGGTLFIGYPSAPVRQVCVQDSLCLTPTNTVGEVMPWDGPLTVIRAELADGSWQIATPLASFVG